MTLPNNTGICGKCKGDAPARHTIRDGKVYLTKDCPTCGITEALISSNAEVWQKKRQVWEYDSQKAGNCNLQCGSCNTDHDPAYRICRNDKPVQHAMPDVHRQRPDWN